jgi:hypothetical protein
VAGLKIRSADIAPINESAFLAFLRTLDVILSDKLKGLFCAKNVVLVARLRYAMCECKGVTFLRHNTSDIRVTSRSNSARTFMFMTSNEREIIKRASVLPDSYTAAYDRKIYGMQFVQPLNFLSAPTGALAKY